MWFSYTSGMNYQEYGTQEEAARIIPKTQKTYKKLSVLEQTKFGQVCQKISSKLRVSTYSKTNSTKIINNLKFSVTTLKLT